MIVAKRTVETKRSYCKKRSNTKSTGNMLNLISPFVVDNDSIQSAEGSKAPPADIRDLQEKPVFFWG